jgi:hypothetical protein
MVDCLKAKKYIVQHDEALLSFSKVGPFSVSLK